MIGVQEIFERQRARHFRERQIPAQHQADIADLGFEHGQAEAFAERHALFAAQVLAQGIGLLVDVLADSVDYSER